MPAWAIVLIVIAVVIVLVGVLGVVMFVLMTPLESGPPTRPVVTFTGVQSIADGFEFSVAGVSQARPAANYRVALLVNVSSGAPITLTPSMSFVIGGNAYACAWTDAAGEGQLTRLDVFRVTRAGGLPVGTEYTFTLLWTDGSQLATVSYQS